MRPLIDPRPVTVHPRRKWLPVAVALVVALTGYFGPWVGHGAAGLNILGVDLAEYVKFLPAYRAGQLDLLRESFYAPLAAGSLIAGLLASRRVLPLAARWLAGAAAIPLALAMLPPAWSPAVLLMPEFRLQVVAIAACTGALLLLPLTRILPDALVLLLVALLALVASVWPAAAFLLLPSPIGELYAATVRPGWGFWLSSIGFLLTAFTAVLGIIYRRPRR